jgi:hypothetical protein
MPVENHILQTLASSEAQEVQARHSLEASTSPLLAHAVAVNEIENGADDFGDQQYDATGRLSLRKSIESKIRVSSIIHDEHTISVPDMWSRDYIGLYCQYAAIGLLYGTSGALLSLCVYVYDGSPNLCANSSNITFFAWSFKIVFAIITDIYRPFGLRRKPWMIFGWSIALMLLLTLTIVADKLDASSWLSLLLLVQFFAMFSDVPADGYCVELGQLEAKERRGQILATGQMIRFTFCILAGFIQSFLLNGPSTNDSGCEISWDNCWSWGLSINQYYALIFSITFVLCIPILWMKEIDPSKIPRHSLKYFMQQIWETLQNLTTLYLLLFVIGTDSLTNFKSVVNTYMQYYVIQLTNFQAGIDTITTYMAVSSAIWVFKTYLLNKNWRYTQYGSTIIASVMGFLWMLVYFNIGGLRDPWFTIFIDLDQQFVQGITQVLFSLAVIELSKPGLEATTYELIITVANASLTVSGIIATQLLTPLKASGCTNDDDASCDSNSVDINSVDGYNDSDGPNRYATYCICITVISVGACLIFTPFLPASKEQCQEWKEEGERAGNSRIRGYITAAMSTVTIIVSQSSRSYFIYIHLMHDNTFLAIVWILGCNIALVTNNVLFRDGRRNWLLDVLP